MICSECGSKNTKTANYCIECGKDLKELKENFNKTSIIKECLENIKGMFFKPVDTARSFIKENNYMTALLYIGLNIIIMTLFILVLVNMLYNTYINSYFNNYMYSNYAYFRLFLISIMMGVISYGVFGGIYLLVNTYLFKDKTNFKEIICWLGINSLFITISYTIMIIGFIISYKLGMIVCLVTLLVYLYNLFKTAIFTTKVDENKLGYILTFNIILTFVIVVLILPNIIY